MRSLSSVRTMLSTVGRTMSRGILVLVVASSAVSVQAEWQDPLNTPSMKTDKAVSSLVLDVALAGDRIIAVGERGHILYSDDSGFNWTQADVPAISTLTSVYFINQSIGWAVGHDALVLNTQDGGLTWTKQFDGFRANKMVLEQARLVKIGMEKELNKVKVMGRESRIALVEEQLENATYALEDAEIDFEDKSTKPLLDLWFKNKNEGFVIGAYGMIFKTMDGGKSWKDWSSHVENPDRFHLNAMAYAGGDKLMIVGESGLILRSSDGGEKIEQTFSPYDGSFFGVISLNKQGVQMAFGLRGNLARSDNFGSSWKLMDTGTQQSLMGGTDRLGRVAYVVGNGGAFIKGIDLGRKWESKIRHGRGSAATIIETKAGHFVMVGEKGIELLDKTGDRLSMTSTHVEGE